MNPWLMQALSGDEDLLTPCCRAQVASDVKRCPKCNLFFSQSKAEIVLPDDDEPEPEGV